VVKATILRSVLAVLPLVALGILGPQAALALDAPPAAPVKPVTDDYFGTQVVDNYRYLEDLADPQVQAWMKAHATYTRAVLDGLPGREGLEKHIHALANVSVDRNRFVRRGQRYFYLSTEPGVQVPRLYYRDGLQGDEHLLLDPAQLGAESTTHYSIDYFSPSWDGRFVAYGLSAGGSEQSLLHVVEVDGGKVLAEAIDRTSLNVIAWRPDNRSFFYLRYVKPTPGMPAAQTLFNARTYLHTVGSRTDGEGDTAVFGRGVAKGLEVPEGQGTYIVLAPGSRFAMAVANHNMDANPSTLYVAPLAQVRGSATPWRKIADPGDGVTQFVLRGDDFVFLSQDGAPRYRLLSTSLAKPDLRHPTVLVPEGQVVLTGIAASREALYLAQRDGAVSRLSRVAWDGKSRRAVPLPFEGAIFGLTTDPRESGVLFGMTGWVQSPRRFAYDPTADAISDTGLIPPSKVDYSPFEAREVFAVSYDGTRVPLSIVYKKGLVLDGQHPTLLQGYGSYGNSQEPNADPVRTAWLERGGVYAIAHVRGGGELGEGWHRAGQKLTKLNTVFDFIACAQYLIDEKYTTTPKLAGIGGSAGGITVGGALTWRPDLFGVILDIVGVSDGLRVETTPNGPPNISEFGTVKTEEGFHGIYAMSAYNHIRDGVHYPAVMFATGANDPRVAPWQMTKMAARLQAASHDRPALLRIDYDAGHGVGSTKSQREALTADLWSFALWQMGDPAFQPAASPQPAGATPTR
jgi:prolyl oligopeptidase